MAKIGAFTFDPDSGTASTEVKTVRISAPATGRTKPSDAHVLVRKVGSGLEKRLTVKQSAAAEFFRIDRIETTQLNSGIVLITVHCTGNVDLRNVACGGAEYYGLYPTKLQEVPNETGTGNKKWEVSYEGATAEISVQQRNNYGIVFANNSSVEAIKHVGENSAYQLTAYLTAPRNSGTASDVYKFLFGKYVGQSLEASVDTVQKTDVLDKTSSPIVVNAPVAGYINTDVVQLDFENSEFGNANARKVYVTASGAWAVDTGNMEDWISVTYPSSTDPEYGKYFSVVPTSQNGSTQRRTATLTLYLVSDPTVVKTVTVGQGEADTTWIFVDIQGDNSEGATSYLPPDRWVTTMVVRANAPFTLNEDSFPDWITITGRYPGVDYGEYDKYYTVYDVIFSALGANTERQFGITATLNDTNISYTRTVVQEVPVSVFVTGVTPELPYYSFVPVADYESSYGNATSVIIFNNVPEGDTNKTRTMTLSINASGPWTYTATSGVTVLDMGDDFMRIRVSRSGSELFQEGITFKANHGVARAWVELGGRAAAIQFADLYGIDTSNIR